MSIDLRSKAKWIAFVAVSVVLLVATTARAQGGFDDLPGGDENSALAKQLAMPDGPSDQNIFLRAIVDKQKVVVGEQVTLYIYLYYRVAYELSEKRDPKLGDALRYPLLTDPSATPTFTKVKGERYGARLVERLALVPIRSGDLVTGGMSARFTGRQIGSRVLKTSNDITITVLEPPKDGRPPGYVLGDTGDFTLTATVSPKHTEQGGAVGVTVKLEGTGNLPMRIAPPDVAGTKWLDPVKKEMITADPRKLLVGGSRTFQYVVRLEKSGDVDLGTVTVPFYNPAKQKYEVATTQLGTIRVDPRAMVATKDDGSDPRQREPLWSLPKHRSTLKSFVPTKPMVVTMRVFLAGLFGPPAFALLIIGLVRLRTVVVARRQARGAQLRGALKDALKDAAKADKANDPRSACAAIERAVHAALEAKTGLKTRAYRMDELEPVVTEAGLDRSLATEAKDILSQCESLRFMPSVDDASFEGLRTRAKALTKRLAA